MGLSPSMAAGRVAWSGLAALMHGLANWYLKDLLSYQKAVQLMIFAAEEAKLKCHIAQLPFLSNVLPSQPWSRP